MKYVEFMKVVPLHDDLFDFFYEALPGYEEVGRRRVLLGCWGCFQNPEAQFRVPGHDGLGRTMYVTPGVVVDGKLVTNDLVKINLGIRILLGSSYYEDWDGREIFVTHGPTGQPGGQAASLESAHDPRPQKRQFGEQYSWVMSPRWYDGNAITCRWTPAAAARAPLVHRARGLVDIGYIKATGNSVQINLPKTALKTGELRVEDSAVVQCSRARPRPHLFSGVRRGLRAALRGESDGRGPRRPHEDVDRLQGAERSHGCGFTEAVRGVLSHHMVIRGGKIANYHPYPPTPWNASPRDYYGTPGPYEDAVQGQPIFEENGRDKFKGIDIMRTVRSFDPACLAAFTCTSATGRC